MYPSWLIKKTPKSSNIRKIRKLINDDSIHTVCESAKCPNIGECYSKDTVTFMILGSVCTRNCRFCSVSKGIPSTLDPKEPEKIAEAAKKLGLKYVVITSVTRDDLDDGGAGHFADTIQAVRSTISEAKIEVLIPDLQGDEQNLSKIVEAKPNIINHNLETVPRLYEKIRPQADYKRSLNVLKLAKIRSKLHPHTNFKEAFLEINIDTARKNMQNPSKKTESQVGVGVYTKSGIMVGLGEKQEEVVRLMEDLRNVDCDIMTIGQYLRPSKEQIEVSQFVTPDVFEEYRQTAERLGFKKVFSGPFVRSSYKASEIYV